MGCEDYDPMYCECRDCSECPYRIEEADEGE